MTSDNKAPKSPDSQEILPLNPEPGIIEPIALQEELEQSFLEYAMSVIISRALPDVRDGLKPVHRRILYGMYDQNIRPDRPFVKCARVVGDVMGRFHPHGDAAIYDALVRMVQDFSLREPLVEGHGSFGSTSPEDGPAAMRYTECRLAPIAMDMLAGIDEQTVDMVPNYDGSEIEPVVLPSRFPNILVNGSQGIAVGMATNIPPHNLSEVIDAVIYQLDHPDATPEDLMQFVKGPDFPTGALIVGRAGIRDAYKTGRGSIRLRAVANIEETRSSHRIVVTEFAYQTSPEVIATKVADLVKSGQLEGISHVQNASSGRQPKLVIELKRDANPNIVLNNLYKKTPMQISFGFNMLAIVDGAPRILNLSQTLSYYIAHQVEVITRRSNFRLEKARQRAHIVEGLLRAIDILDAVIQTIRNSDDRAVARERLCEEPFSFSVEQANHILDMTLARLTRLGRSELSEELIKLRETIEELSLILNNPSKLRLVIADELKAVKVKYGNDRRSKIISDEGTMVDEDFIDDKEVVITLSNAGYIKATEATAFKTQGRGGRGIKGARLKEEDLIEHIVYTSLHAHLLFFTNKGKVYRYRAFSFPLKERTAKGTPIVNILPLESGEHVQAIVDTKDFKTKPYLLFATKNAIVKKTPFSEYDKSRKEGFIAITLKERDELVSVIPTSGDSDVICVSRKGQLIRFSESSIRPSSRQAQGVIGMRLKNDDSLVSCDVLDSENDLLIITDAGYGKRIKLDKIRTQVRGGKGIIGIKLTEKKGQVVAAFIVTINSELILVSTNGITMRLLVKQITSQGRAATGIRIMRLEEGQRVASAALVETDETS